MCTHNTTRTITGPSARRRFSTRANVPQEHFDGEHVSNLAHTHTHSDALKWPPKCTNTVMLCFQCLLRSARPLPLLPLPPPGPPPLTLTPPACIPSIADAEATRACHTVNKAAAWTPRRAPLPSPPGSLSASSALHCLQTDLDFDLRRRPKQLHSKLDAERKDPPWNLSGTR